jgi:hypothetical protein
MYNHPLFNELTKEERDKFVQIFIKKEIPKNTILIKEGDTGDSAFLLP